MYSTFLERLSPAAVAAIAILLVTGWSSRLRRGQRRARPHEIAAVAGFVLLPVIAYLLAKTATGALVPRYVLLTVTGLAIGIAFAGWEALGRFLPAGFVVAAALAVNAAGGEAAFAYKQRQLRAELTRDNLPAIVHDLPGPIVVTDNDLLMPLWHYEPAAVAERLVFLSDERAAVEIQGFNTIEMLFPRLKPFSDRVQIEPYAAFVREHPRFLLMDALRGYVAKKLLEDGATLTVKAAYGTKWVFQVETAAARPR